MTNNSSEADLQGWNHGADAEHAWVRALLMSLPKVPAPAGFEFRLRNRLSRVAEERHYERRPSWLLNWAGLGLGFATAFLLAAIVFDFDSQNPLPVPSGASQVAAGAATVKQPGVNQESVPVSVPEQMAQEPPVKREAKKDSATQSKPSDLPQDLYKMVGGSSR